MASSSSLPSSEIQNFLKFGLNFLAQSRPFILKVLAEGLGTTTKADASIVTKADVGTEELFRAYVSARYPEHGVLGEEFGHTNKSAAFQWVIDPIDGTAEFARGMPEYGTIIGLFYNQQPIVGIIDLPSLNETYSAARGQGAFRNQTRLDLSTHVPDAVALNRRVATSPPWNFIRNNGSPEPFRRLEAAFPNLRIYHSCYSQILAARGAVDASVEWNMRIWDLAAAQVLIEEACGVCLLIDPPDDWAAGRYNMVIGSRETATEVFQAVQKN